MPRRVPRASCCLPVCLLPHPRADEFARATPDGMHFSPGCIAFWLAFRVANTDTVGPLWVHDTIGGAYQSPKRQRGEFVDRPWVFGPARLRSGL